MKFGYLNYDDVIPISLVLAKSFRSNLENEISVELVEDYYRKNNFPPFSNNNRTLLLHYEFCKSKTYENLFRQDTGLWEKGLDYIISLYEDEKNVFCLEEEEY